MHPSSRDQPWGLHALGSSVRSRTSWDHYPVLGSLPARPGSTPHPSWEHSSPHILLQQKPPSACAQGTPHGPTPETMPCCPQLPGTGCVLSTPKRRDGTPTPGVETSQDDPPRVSGCERSAPSPDLRSLPTHPGGGEGPRPTVPFSVEGLALRAGLSTNSQAGAWHPG